MTLLLLVAGFTTASAGATWIGDSYINVNGAWYTASGASGDWTSGAFNDHDFGAITSLTIGAQIQVYAGEDWKSGTLIMHYTIDKNESGWTDHVLQYESYGHGQFGNNMRYQSGGSTFTTTPIDISSLSAGEHTLSIYFGPLDGNYDGNSDNSYVATFTVPGPQSVEVTSAGYATYVGSYPLDFTATGIKAYTAKVNTENGKVVLTQINKVPASTPVVLYKDGGSTKDIPICFSATDTPAESDLVAGNGGKVAYASGDGKYNYILNNVSGIGFYKANDQTVATGRAYLQTSYDVTTSSGARMAMVFADEATGIDATQMNSEEKAASTYDLQGRCVAQPVKGLYIVNGKKVIVK